MIPRRFVRMFKPRFADKVEAGTKRQTVRPEPKRMPKVGDLFDARAWIGRPYFSKQRKLIEGEIIAVWRISIYEDHYYAQIGEIGAPITNRMALDDFARDDGFASWSDLVDWFLIEHGLPFRGIIICWEPNSNGEPRASDPGRSA